LLELLDAYLPVLEERTILAVTSKIISICHGRIVDKRTISKEELIRREADVYLETENGTTLTLKNGLLIPAAGIDESNSEEGYILYPEAVQEDAFQIWRHLKEKHRLHELGVLITDSRTTILRRGVTGIALGWCGFVPYYDYIGQPDLFGRPLRVTVSNLLDALAAAAVLVMGEGSEQTPLALITQAPKVAFVDRAPSQEEARFVSLSPEEDLYFPLLRGVPWKSKS
jgi:putative folate metabolism gamma-glutamate ligase